MSMLFLVQNSAQRCFNLFLKQRGITLIELLLVLAITGIIMGLATPSLAVIIQNYRLKSTAQEVYSQLQYARSDALRLGLPININFKQNENTWCYGVSDNADIDACDCLEHSSCTISGKEKIHTHLVDVGISLLQARFAGPGDILVFSPDHGMAVGGGSVHSGSIWLKSRQGKMTAVVISRLGRIRICDAGESGCPTPPEV